MPSSRNNSLSKKRKPHEVSGRPAKRKLGDKPPVSSESNLGDGTGGLSSSSPQAQVSFFITQAQTAQLREKGYSDEQIAQMKPAEAHRILGFE